MDKKIVNTHGELLDYAFEEGKPDASVSDTIVILGHGVTGNKDRPVLVDTASALRELGFHTLRFSYAGNGESEGDFKDATITKETGDLKAVLDAVNGLYRKIAYVGHSMGAAVGAIVAAGDPRIHAMVSLGGMVDTKAFAEREFGDLTPDEDVMWEDEDCPLSSAFMKDLCTTVGDVTPSAKDVSVPWLLVHGTEDDVVLPKDSGHLKTELGERVDLVSVEGADHVFSKPDHTKSAAGAIGVWLLEKFSS